MDGTRSGCFREDVGLIAEVSDDLHLAALRAIPGP
jgi:hypothetical protein